MALLLPFAAGCADQVVGFPIDDDTLLGDETAPTVVATAPQDDATGVTFNAPIYATFSEAMAPASIDAAHFSVSLGDSAVEGVVTYAGLNAQFVPTRALAENAVYTATVRAGVLDLAGNAMVSDYTWSFTRGGDVDTTRPRVVSTSPDSGATAVMIDTVVRATFDEAMDPATLSTASFTLFAGQTQVPGTVSYSGLTATLDPTPRLEQGTVYTARVTSSAMDLSGNALHEYSWSFTTGTNLDTTRPQVSSTVPANGATGVAIGSALTVTFSEAMDPLSITTTTITLRAGATAVQGTVTYVGVTATFDPSANLANDTTYTATVQSDVKDLAQNQMAADFVWTFTTGSALDTTPPRVSSTSPPSDATRVALNAAITATFSEAMDPLTINNEVFTLRRGTTVIAGVVTWAGVTATFDPNVELDANTLYTATITRGAKDLSGNAMLADYVWSFTTGPARDDERPRVTFTVPSDDTTGVPVGSAITATFSEPMDPTTITTVNITVQQLGVSVPGTVTYNNVTATFTPLAPFSPNTTYSATVTTSTRDLAGNRLVQNYVWNFRTGATNDTTRPTVISTNPPAGATDVVLDTRVSATFSEAMASLSLTTATFTVEDADGLIAGTVSHSGATAVFAPTSPLAPDTEYTATITVAASDLAGNTLALEYTWRFTTGSVLDPGAPTVILTSPVDLAIEVPIDSTVNAAFSEAMDPLTISTATFIVTGPGGSEVTGTVLYDGVNHIASFTPETELLPNTLYYATISMVASDLAGKGLVEDFEWSFSTADENLVNPAAIDLGTLSTFVAVAGAGLSNSNSSGTTILNGDVGLSPTATCMGDGAPCTLTNPVINGTLYMNDPAGIAAQAKTDLTAAYVEATSRPPGTVVNDISGLVLAPGVYTSGSTMSVAVGGTVTLDGQGDPNAVWIFQIGSSLTVNNNAKVLLINGARAKNVFWAVFASSTLGSNVNFQGSVLAGASNTVGTDSVIVGRLLCTTGMITLLSNTITLPPL